ncbi:type I polyketide synthase [Actinokineospora xionganensis]|uniref:SDR family NAD(P)-dependent oxidoreductase n=1 Tax=Actinokineospora xionganensis TaxID=2684470 RepID=A0ABR7LD16_9PSEU|nr:type I polyketide synthase [Actinokineospora xionganensis]MBC6450549.1 SDR family NAD(P)-dependent oxidoreductase [Actinokineospora xionganensis]
MSSERIAIVGIGLRYPDASSPAELWENVLSGRRAFRRLPDERMNHADYWSPDPKAPDRFYASKAAVLKDFEFDRVKFKIAGSTFRSTDMTHWLALAVATQALADAGFPEGEGLPKQSTGVVFGNSLTGEFSRANIMRVRWPYVRRTVAATLADKGWSEDETTNFLAELETQYKAPFPLFDEDTLAGGLANTIAGRVCNHFDLGGGGYTVDGACSSSLLSIATAAKALVDGDMDVAIAGGVDLSIDPFEVIGFAKTGALATGEMKVYDKDSNGFWPGEGSGVVVLMRESDAIARGGKIYACISGWGISSDGKGGITRPAEAGHRLALTRAYGRAGYGVETVSYFEGHGTGTAVGDATEIEALSTARHNADPTARPAALGTIKGNIGHAKAAAGIAGLIKATLALHHQVIPPGTGQKAPHPLLEGDSAAMYVPQEAELFPTDVPLRAGVSAMGFGGINTHIALEQAAGVTRRTELAKRTTTLVSSRQDTELLLLDADNVEQLRDQLTRVAALAHKLAFAELGDLAGTLSGELAGRPLRAAVVTNAPEDAERKLNRIIAALDAGETSLFSPVEGVFLDNRTVAPKLAFLFPGQGSGRGAVGAIRRRFPVADHVFGAVTITGDQVATEVAQPRIVTGSLAGLRVLHALGIEADIAVGHSLGELTALAWAGAMGGPELQELAKIRGQVMAQASHGGGAMAGLAIDPDGAERLMDGYRVVIAGYNSPGQTVISGAAEAVDAVCKKAAAEGVTATRINVSHAFHSPLVQPAAEAMTDRLAERPFERLARQVASTVTGDVLDPDTDLRTLLVDQVLLPVRFTEAAARAARDVDLLIEVGPGRVLTSLVGQIAPDKPVLALDTDSASLSPLLTAVGAAFALGAPVDASALFTDRLVRPLALDGEMTFLSSPCEAAPAIDAGLVTPLHQDGDGGGVASAGDSTPLSSADATPADSGISTLELLCKLAAERVELPLETVTADTHPLDDLHLSSISVGQIINEVTRELGRPALAATTNFATVTLGQLAELIDDLADTAQGGSDAGKDVAGIGAWVRPFSVEYVQERRPSVDVGVGAAGQWQVFAPQGHPLAEPLRAGLAKAGIGDGVLLCLPNDGEPHVDLFLAAGKAAIAAAAEEARFVVVQHHLGASGLARTLHLEALTVRTTVVGLADTEPSTPDSIAEVVSRVVGEAAATNGFSEVRYSADGTRTTPVLKALTAPAGPVGPSPLDSTDVLLVTGGGKGITAECALAMAQDSSAKLALLGRADPAKDTELAENLARMEAAGVTFRYERADVTSPEEIAGAVARFEAELGPVTAFLHGAGRNEPGALASLSEEDFERTLAPKIAGLRAVLDAVDQDKIKLLVTFGSIIGRAGLRGEAHYSTANDWMSELTVKFGEEHPNARVLALEWSVWSGAGMGEKLGVVEMLMRDGITPISTENGIAVLREVLADPSAGPVLVVSGRAAGLPTVEMEEAELPMTRFVDQVVVHYPGIELITEAELSAGSDPYLEDHLLDGDLLFPAVIGMEAMTQVASALTGSESSPLLENVEFLRPIAVRPGGSTTIRLAALVRDAETVDVALRSEETGFSADHFRATLKVRPELPQSDNPDLRVPVVALDPTTELYGSVMFQGKRFQRVQAYRKASARHAVAELGTSSPAPWFAAYLPQQRLLADPGTRDAVMHAIQCCVPDGILLPQGVEKLYLAQRSEQDTEYVVMDARERYQDGDSYTYDVDVRTPEGQVVERWEGLVLRAVRSRNGAGPWVPPLLGSYVERSLERVLGGSRSVVIEPDAEGAERREQTELAVSRALGRTAGVRHRPDGKPEIDGATVTASHGAGLTFAVVGSGRLGCDVESALERTEEDWTGLLGADQLALRDLLAAEAADTAAVAGTRIWGALESLRKAGITSQALTLDRVHSDGWVVLSAGDVKVATWVTTINGQTDPVVFAVLSGEEL